MRNYSVSCDTHFVHKAWHDANEKIAKIQYPMLADPTALLAKDLDTYNEVDGMAERGDFIVSPEGKVVAYEVISSNVGRNAEELLRRVQASQFVHEHGDQVCPANWTPGETPSNLASILLANCDRYLTDGLSICSDGLSGEPPGNPLNRQIKARRDSLCLEMICTMS